MIIIDDGYLLKFLQREFEEINSLMACSIMTSCR
jgi:hypothetical protein